MKDRLAIFRAYMAQFDAAADPARAIDRGQYVASAQALAERVRPRVELEPHSTHLLTGGVGSGKTTQLLVLREAIAKLPDTTAVYIDVTRHQDLEHMQAGVLLLLAALELSRLVPRSTATAVADANKQLRRWTQGYSIWVDDDGSPWEEEPDHDYESPEGRYIRVPAELTPPPAPGPLFGDALAKLDVLKTLRAAAQPVREHLVMLFDGLDRMRSTMLFRDIVEQDVQALRSASIGVVLVGPIDVIYAKEKATRDMFDALWHLSPVDVATPEGVDFLVCVLRKRASADILPDDVCSMIARRSGGVLRDLIKLARQAGYEAYAAGADRVGAPHVEAAVDALGRAQLQAVGKDGVEILQRVRTKGTFIPTSDRELTLLASRNVLEYQDGARIRYAVHPAIEGLLADLPAS